VDADHLQLFMRIKRRKKTRSKSKARIKDL